MRPAFAGMSQGDLQPRLLAAVALAAALLNAAPSAAVAPPIPGNTTTLSGPDTLIPIPDNSSVVAIVNYTGPGNVIDVDVTVDITHPQPDNLDIWLVAPSGKTVTLTTGNGAGFDDVFHGTTFDDQATGTPSAPNVRNFTYVNLVPTGPIQPEQPLGAFIGEPAAGPWALVVVDHQNGNTGTLRSWSMTLTTSGGVHPSAPTSFAGEGPKTINAAAGVTSNAVVSGVGPLLYDVNVTVDITHTNAADLDVFLTSPSGKRIDLVTDVGGANDDLFAGTTFDDQSSTLVGDAMLPANGVAFTAVAGEGALSDFIGENPNGTWTLTVVDDTSQFNGRLNGWSLAIVTATACGDGVVDAGEQCDDGNVADGDGCDSNCTPTGCGNGIVDPGEDCDDGNTVGGDACPSTCHDGETNCSDCVDNDSNGLVDAADPACEPGGLELRSVSFTAKGGKLKINGGLALPANPTGAVTLVLGDGKGTVFCTPLGDLSAHGKSFSAKGAVGNGSITLKLTTKRGGTLALRGRGVDLTSAASPTLSLGLVVGGQRFAASGALRGRGNSRWVYP